MAGGTPASVPVGRTQYSRALAVEHVSPGEFHHAKSVRVANPKPGVPVVDVQSAQELLVSPTELGLAEPVNAGMEAPKYPPSANCQMPLSSDKLLPSCEGVAMRIPSGRA